MDSEILRILARISLPWAKMTKTFLLMGSLRLGNLGLVHVQVASQRSPEYALKGGHAVPRDDTGHETDVHARERSLDLGGLVMLLDILQQGRVVVVGRRPDLLDVAVCSVEEAAGLAENPAPLG
jgi:hypothetical protein